MGSEMGVGGESSFHVLAVDDNVVDRKLIERLLQVSSFQVTTVDSGMKALEFLGFQENDFGKPLKSSGSPSDHQKVEVDIIITDYRIPGMTGYDLLTKIKESSSLRNIPVVIMSSENIPSIITSCLEGGAEEFLLKPVKLSDINKLKLHMMKAKMKGKAPEHPGESETESHCREKHDVEEEKDSKTNKRKAMEETISPDRTRSGYNPCCPVI